MRTVVGFYDRYDSAQKAVHALLDEGFENDHISLIAQDAGGKYARELGGWKEGQEQDVIDGAAKGAGTGAVLGGLGGLLVGLGALAIPGIGPVIAAGPIASTLAGAGIGAVAGGIIGALVDLGIPEEHAGLYAEGIRRGGTLVAVRTDDRQANQAAMILNRYSPVDIEKQAETWRRDNWQGFDAKADPLSMQQMESNQVVYDEVPVTGDEVNIPVIEEELHVDKREVDRGGVHVETHVEDQPFQEDVAVRKENINIDRRPADREYTGDKNEAFKEWTMEFEEVFEEPVIDKRAQVVEEVHISKNVDTETQTIQDTLRRQEVDVERVGPGGDWQKYDSVFNRHFQQTYAKSRRDYSYYQPAYRYGYTLANDPRYSGYAARDWPTVEGQARKEWESRGEQNAWEEIKEAVWHAWNTLKQ